MAEAPAAFFSYCRDDSDFALRLAEDLKAAGAAVWIDQLDIRPGQNWDIAMEGAVRECPRMLLILSPASVQSRNVRNEIAFALNEQKTIIPVLFDDCAVPLQLRRFKTSTSAQTMIAASWHCLKRRQCHPSQLLQRLLVRRNKRDCLSRMYPGEKIQKPGNTIVRPLLH